MNVAQPVPILANADQFLVSLKHSVVGWLPEQVQGISSILLTILPITLDEPSWDAMMAGAGSDDYSFDKSTNTVVAGPSARLRTSISPERLSPAMYSPTTGSVNPTNSVANAVAASMGSW